MPPDGSSSASSFALPDRYTQLDGELLMTGIQALVRLPMDQRRADIAAGFKTAGFITGYPGSPLAGYDLELKRRRGLLEELGIVHQPGLNEELAATAVAGSQLSALQRDRTVEGVCAVWYGKAPGLDRAGDAIRHGNLMGAAARGGVLVCVGDDPLAKSSSVPSTSEPTLYGLGLPFLSPADPQEILEFGRHGFALSRAAGLWVGLRIPASVADAYQSIDLATQRFAPVLPELDTGGGKFAHEVSAHLLGSRLIDLERSLYGPRLELARRYAAANDLDRVTRRGADDVLGVIAAGPAYLTVQGALRLMGLEDSELGSAGIRLMKVAMPYPLEPGALRDFAGGLTEILVVEDKRGFLEMQVKDALYGRADAPGVVGKRDSTGGELLPSTGELDADAVAAAIARRLLARREVPAARYWLSRSRPAPVRALPLARGPYFCSGCPHNTAVKVPAGARVGSGSGCHGLAIQMDPRQAGEIVGRFQMGGEGAMWNGMAPFVSSRHFFQNLGDGTFAHSGSLAVRAAVASGVNITFKLLVNSTVAMTGGQEVTGGLQVEDLSRLLLAEGVRRIIVTTDDAAGRRYPGLPAGVEVWDRKRIVAAQELLAATPGVTALIHDQPCAAAGRRDRSHGHAPQPAQRVFINALVCDGCGDCGAKSNCLSVRPVQTEFGRKTRIHQESCNADYSCLDADCPAFVTVRPAGRARANAVGAAPLPTGALPAPAERLYGKHFTMRIAGAGGTGVITAARIVAMAAHLQGYPVRGLDQTGIAQKGGAVVSDLRVGPGAASAHPRLAAGECDLYLGADLLVAADPKNLLAASASRTVAVVSTEQVPTGRQVADPSIPSPSLEAIKALIAERTRPGENVWLDASAMCRTLLGSDMYANVFLLGAAYQQGTLPLDPDLIERAIRINGADADTNIQAFRYGRLAVARPASGAFGGGVIPGEDDTTEGRAEALVRMIGARQGSELRRIARIRLSELIAYQDYAYARSYAELLTRCRAAEAVRCGLPDGPFAKAVAIQLYRLMAYKDEYEVARLHMDPRVRSEIEEEFGPGAQATFRLHPPLLQAAGSKRTVTLGRGASVAFRSLRSMRALRGSTVDPFGQSPLRRMERDLRDQYRALVGRLAEELDGDNHHLAVEIAGLPEMIRGFGAAKLASAERYRERLAALESRL